jgi:hypothetical protein
MKKSAAVLILLALAIFSPAAFPAGKKQDFADKVDFPSLNQEIQRFEGVLNNVINSAFSELAFQKAKGVYFQEYGTSFSFLVNIHVAANVAAVNTPFGQFKSREALVLEAKRRRIEELKDKLIAALQNYGVILHQLKKEQYVSVVAHIEDRNFPDEPSANKTIVISVLKKDLDEFSNRKDLYSQFKQRIKIIEY